MRFPQFSTNWETKRIDEVTEKISVPVDVNKFELYRQIGIRSHGKGLFHKALVTGESLGNKRVFWVQENLFVVNIVFAWEQAVAKTTKAEVGMIASHRFPMFKPLEDILDLDFLLALFLTNKGKALLELASPGGAGRNKTLGQSEFAKLKINIPTLAEQQKIATFLTAVDEKIQQLTKKKDLLEQYKKAMMQKIFNQEIRFKDDDGNDFADWEEKKLGDVAKFSKGKGISKSDISENGNLECIRYGQLYTYYKETISEVISKTTIDKSQLVLSEYNDVIIPASGETQLDIATASCVLKTGVALGGDLNIIKSNMNGVFLSYYLNNKKKLDIANLAQGMSVVHLYSSQLATLKIDVPHTEEQNKIANFLSAIEEKINLVDQQLKKTKEFRKGLLQQMFV